MLPEVLELDKITKKWAYTDEKKPAKENETRMILSAGLVNGIPSEIVD